MCVRVVLYPAPVYEGFDAALIIAGGETADIAARHVRTGGRIAYPNGVYPLLQALPEVNSGVYNGDPDPEIVHRLNNIINSGKLRVHIDKIFSLENAYAAHLALSKHYTGKLCLQVCN